jgi:hypothetical protein
MLRSWREAWRSRRQRRPLDVLDVLADVEQPAAA